MITIDHTIKEPSSLGFLYSPTDECIGEIENELQLYDVQIQICTQNLDGYYIKWKDERLDISNDGQVMKWPANYCDQTLGAFAELHRARMAKQGKTSPLREDPSWRHSEEKTNA